MEDEDKDGTPDDEDPDFEDGQEDTDLELTGDEPDPELLRDIVSKERDEAEERRPWRCNHGPWKHACSN